VRRSRGSAMPRQLQQATTRLAITSWRALRLPCFPTPRASRTRSSGSSSSGRGREAGRGPGRMITSFACRSRGEVCVERFRRVCPLRGRSDPRRYRPDEAARSASGGQLRASVRRSYRRVQTVVVRGARGGSRVSCPDPHRAPKIVSAVSVTEQNTGVVICCAIVP
jgi:hypothetical protein